MATEFKLPNLGENVESGDVVSVLVNEGDEITENQPILELETDKATVEVPSTIQGKVTQVHVSVGDTVQIGQVILTVEEVEAAAEAEEAKADEKAEVAAAESVSRPDPAEEKEEPIAGEEEQKPTEEAAPPRKGEVVDFRDRSKAEPEPVAELLIPASPAVRRFAREIGIDISKVPGSGPRGRISVEDVKEYSRQLRSREPEKASPVPSPSLPDFSRFGEVRREPFSNVRRATARQMATAWATIPHVTQHDEADITQLEELRKQYSSRVEEAGGKLTVTSIALKVLVAALKKFPVFNASIDVENEEVIYK